jgi:hypothetical protein
MDNIKHNGISWAYNYIRACSYLAKIIRVVIAENTIDVPPRRVFCLRSQCRDYRYRYETTLESVSQIMQLRIIQIDHVRLDFAVTRTMKNSRALVRYLFNDNKWLGQTLAFTSTASQPTVTSSPHLLKHLHSRVNKANTRTPR